MAVNVRLLQPQEAHLANTFFNTIYKTNRPFENFAWEFLNGPFGKAIYVIAVDDAVTTYVKIVGIQCAIPIELISSKGKTILTAKSEDTLVDPSYRGQKIFERMYDLLFEECKKAGIKYIWGFTPAQKAFERIGFEIPFKTEQALLVKNPWKSYQYLKTLNPENKIKDKIKIMGLSLLSWAKGMKRFFIGKEKISEVPVKGKESLFTRFYSNTTLYTLHESDSYLTWRIQNNPFENSYRSFQLLNNNEVIADALVNNRKGVGYIERIWSSSDSKNFTRTISTEILKGGAPVVRAFCFSSNTLLETQGRELTTVGFTYLKRGNYFVWKSLDSENEIKPNQLVIHRLFTQGNL